MGRRHPPGRAVPPPAAPGPARRAPAGCRAGPGDRRGAASRLATPGSAGGGRPDRAPGQARPRRPAGNLPAVSRTQPPDGADGPADGTAAGLGPARRGPLAGPDDGMARRLKALALTAPLHDLDARKRLLDGA